MSFDEAQDWEHASEVSNGLSLGNLAGFFSGVVNPNTITTVDNAPDHSIYFRTNGQQYYKSGNEWTLRVTSGVQLIASDDILEIQPHYETRLKTYITNYGLIRNYNQLVVD